MLIYIVEIIRHDNHVEYFCKIYNTTNFSDTVMFFHIWQNKVISHMFFRNNINKNVKFQRHGTMTDLQHATMPTNNYFHCVVFHALFTRTNSKYVMRHRISRRGIAGECHTYVIFLLKMSFKCLVLSIYRSILYFMEYCFFIIIFLN